HVYSFVIISGDSDFSPLVSKLRENDKTVIGVGVKNSTSDLFINNCDEFIYYDDLVRARPAQQRRRPVAGAAAPRSANGEPQGPSLDKAFDQVLETIEAIGGERQADEAIWGSMIKQAIKRRNPGFNERAYGFRSFNDLLLEAQKRGLLKLDADEKSGGYVVCAL
ncbi:MAG: NYN domain-containing protein, partial [Chthoniobacteraceae bacterium]